MMEYTPNHISLPQWMPLLQQLWPCHTAVLINSGKADISILNSARYAHLQGLIAEHDGLVPFYQLSFPVENGLLPAQALKSCWPNIKDVRVEMVEAISLDTALKQYESDTVAEPIFNWLWLTSMPSLPLMRSAKNFLTQLDVILARVMLQPDAPIEAGLMNLVHYLEYNGFVLVGVESERNPAFGTALFVRNHKSELQNELNEKSEILLLIEQKLHQQIKLGQELQAKLDAETKALAEAQAQAEQLGKDKASVQAQKEAETRAKAELQHKLEAEAKAKAEVQQKLSAETQVKQAVQAKLDAETKALAEAQAQVKIQAEQHSADQAALQTQKEAEAKVKAEALAAHDAQAKLASERQAALEVANKAKVELQQKLEAEAKAKAEALQKLQQETQAKQVLQAKCDAETKAKAELNAQREQLAKENSALTSARDEQARLAAERLLALTTQQQTAFQKQKQLKTLEAENKEYVTRQLLMQSELTKAEAQIELIKELFLRDQRS